MVRKKCTCGTYPVFNVPGETKPIREKRFEDVVITVKDILKTCDTRVVYI